MLCEPEIRARLFMHPDTESFVGHQPIKSGIRCPMSVDNDNQLHDCMVMFESVKELKAGMTCDDGFLVFLFPELVLPKLTVGTKFRLWELRFFAEEK